MTLLRLDRPESRILIVEDHQPWLTRLSTLWQEAGNPVWSMLGVEEIEGGVAKGKGLDAPVQVPIAQVQVAFLDHYFDSRRFNGASLTRELIEHQPHIRICGMSSDRTANLAMIREGALVALRKADLMALF